MAKGSPQCRQICQQAAAIFLKNLRNHLSNKKKLLGELLMPLLVSLVFIASQRLKEQNPIVSVLFELMLKIYLGLLGTSALRQLITLFMTQRNEQFRQYQMIFGVSFRVHTLSNLFYMGVYQSFFLFPFYLTLNYYGIDPAYILDFAALVISSSTLALALTTFFKDHKIALELIGMLFSLGAFLPFLYDQNTEDSWLNFAIMAFPNSSFTVAILYHHPRSALISLAFVKVYLLVYSLGEFPEFFISCLQKCCQRLGHYVPAFDRQPTHLMEEFQLNEVVNSELEQNISHRSIAIKTDALVKSYTIKGNKINALNSLSIKIYQSQIFGLLGRNGAGKTTLVDILTGVAKPTQGSFAIAENSSIGICYQHQILYESLTVEEHLHFYARIKIFDLREGETRQTHVDEVIRTLGIQGERRKKAKELSGGNKRKLSIAIAILGRPEVLIFDEPTSGLDPLSRIYVWEVLQELRRMKSTIILTTHHLDEAERLTDWICVIEKGAVIVENTAAQIKEKYGKGFHLEICMRNSEAAFKYQDIERYKMVADKNKLKAIELEHIHGQINHLIKPAAKEASAIEFEKAFVKLIAELEGEAAVEVRFHSNTLEQSFIAILRDEENSSGDSLAEQTFTTRDQHDPQTMSWVWGKQVVGVFLKSLLYHKSTFLQSLIIYNINILIILISRLFNNLFRDNLQAGAEVKQDNPMMLLQGYTIMATAFITLPVYEKEKKILGVLSTRGLGWTAYWTGSFIFDYGCFCINLLVLAKWVAVREVEQLGMASIFLLGVGIILYTYCASHLFSRVKSASTWFSVINMVVSIILMPMILFGKNTFFSYLDPLKYLYPYYDLTATVFFQNDPSIEKLSELTGLAKPEGSTLPFCICFYAFTLVLAQCSLWQRAKAYLNGQEGNQTINEKVRLENVSKSFGETQALSNVSYYLNEERLALLGHNGAGKSTTFGLLSSQITADSGEVYLQSRLRQPWQRKMQSAGICYQEDALWQGMLVDEILSIFSWLVPINDREREVKWLFENLEYDPSNTYKRFSNLSGGNKRKLCMMIALYGDPALRLLDQCSTGLDPSSRLAMVQTIKASKRGATVFTTHSMSEAEDLCTKAVIMSKGKTLQFQHISTLRSKHFDCCWVEIEMGEGEEKEYRETVARLVTEGVHEEGQGSRRKLQISKQKVRKSEFLAALVENKEKGRILNFSWVQPRLEDVYIKVTRQNGDEGAVEAGPQVI